MLRNLTIVLVFASAVLLRGAENFLGQYNLTGGTYWYSGATASTGEFCLKPRPGGGNISNADYRKSVPGGQSPAFEWRVENDLGVSTPWSIKCGLVNPTDIATFPSFRGVSSVWASAPTGASWLFITGGTAAGGYVGTNTFTSSDVWYCFASEGDPKGFPDRMTGGGVLTVQVGLFLNGGSDPVATRLIHWEITDSTNTTASSLGLSLTSAIARVEFMFSDEGSGEEEEVPSAGTVTLQLKDTRDPSEGSDGVTGGVEGDDGASHVITATVNGEAVNVAEGEASITYTGNAAGADVSATIGGITNPYDFMIGDEVQFFLDGEPLAFGVYVVPETEVDPDTGVAFFGDVILAGTVTGEEPLGVPDPEAAPYDPDTDPNPAGDDITKKDIKEAVETAINPGDVSGDGFGELGDVGEGLPGFDTEGADAAAGELAGALADVTTLADGGIGFGPRTIPEPGEKVWSYAMTLPMVGAIDLDWSAYSATITALRSCLLFASTILFWVLLVRIVRSHSAGE